MQFSTDPHFSGRSYTQPDQVTDGGRGQRAGRPATWPLPEAFAEHGNAAYCKLVGAALARVPDPVVLTQRPRDLKTTVARTDHSTVVHLLSFVPARETPNLCLVHHPVPVVDMPLAVRLDAPPPPVDLEPGSVELDATYDDNYVRTRATVLDGHTMVVFEDTAPTA